MNARNFFAERSNVYKMAVAYAVVAWLLVQIATQSFPFFEVPNWSVRLVLLLLVLGFPMDPRFQKLIADGEAAEAQAQTKP
jgi:hypothetical protein